MPISHQEIRAFSEVMKVQIDPWEVHILVMIDASFRGGEHRDPTVISTKDGKAVANFMRGLSAKLSKAQPNDRPRKS